MVSSFSFCFTTTSTTVASGLDPLSALLLFGGLGLSAAFLLAVFYLDSHPELVMRFINKKLVPEAEVPGF